MMSNAKIRARQIAIALPFLTDGGLLKKSDPVTVRTSTPSESHSFQAVLPDQLDEYVESMQT